MTLKEALNIFGLKENCTEEELKIAYRRLMKANYPDKCKDKEKAEEISKKINDARDIAINYIKLKNNINLNTLRNEYVKELISELKYILKITKTVYDFPVLSYYEKFKSLMFDDFQLKLIYINDIEKAKQEYSNYRKKYITLLYLYNDYIASKIGFNMVDLANHTGIPFYKDITLEFYRDRVLYIINYNLNLELEKYKNIEDYNVLEYLLNTIRETHALSCLLYLKRLSTTKKEFNTHINITINNYYKRKKLLNELIEFDIRKDIIDNLQENILNEKEFYNIYDSIIKPSIKDKIKKKLTRFKNKLKTL